MRLDLALIAFGDVGWQSVQLLESRRGRLLADHLEYRIAGMSDAVVLRTDLLDDTGIRQLGGGLVHLADALLSDLLTIRRRWGPGPA